MNLLQKYTGTKGKTKEEKRLEEDIEFPVSSEISQRFSFHTNKHVDTPHTHMVSVYVAR